MTLSEEALKTLFLDARTHSDWLDKPVSDELLQKIHNLSVMGPTSANCLPMRVVFVRSPEAKEKLKSCLAEGNIEKTMAAPVTAIIAHDMEFYEHLAKLYPHVDARSWFVGNEPLINASAFRNGPLQGAYLMLAARAVGLDCGPMSGFENEKVDATFFADTTYKSNFLCNLGYGNPEKLHPRSPRWEFSEVCRVV